ncbi:hypothetical protein D9756_009258 [Leucocoprinus leucothites]|uniref:Uncharacterized protein n=1 Tax=Leucocoprinus leucothites TaxID=201217 RepID=A0A8H5FV51_9AGAR|nr:hypothetical protein D9756_009258 [Leucoagaricus leucothites]
MAPVDYERRPVYLLKSSSKIRTAITEASFKTYRTVLSCRSRTMEYPLTSLTERQIHRKLCRSRTCQLEMADDVVDLTLKYFEIGSMIAMVLFGMSTIQVYMYFSACQNDPKRIKVFIITTLVLPGRLPVVRSHTFWIVCFGRFFVRRLLELAHTSLSGYSIISSTITYNDKSMKLAHLNRLSVSSGMIANTITSCAQIWFAYRLLKLSQLKIYPYICMFLPGVKFVSFYALTIYKIVTSKSLKYLLVLPSIAACAGDLLTAGGLIWCLRKRNRGDTFSQSP